MNKNEKLDQNIEDFFQEGKKIHLLGIGGISMSPLADVLNSNGITITGSDMSESETVDFLRGKGIDVKIGHSPNNYSIEDTDCIIRSAAIHEDNPEIIKARENNLPVFERAQAWGAIMKKYKNAVCIAGTHGKTTTTSMISQILLEDDQDPSIMIGGYLPILGRGHRVGDGDTIVLESCEYFDSFLSFFPTIAVIMSVDSDHLDYFRTFDNVKKSFTNFANLIPDDGVVIVNQDDEDAMESLKDFKKKVITFGIESGDIHTENLKWHHGLASFDVIANGKYYTHIDLKIPGKYNVLNALGACAIAHYLGIKGDSCKKGLDSFYGVERRFEKKGEYKGADVYDDYAHHPNELKSMLEAIKNLNYNRVICAFQPHTYTRTHYLFDDFVDVLKIPDISILMEIYPAREVNTVGISSKDLADNIPGSIYCRTLDEVTDTLDEIVQPGDLILTVGAGNIFRAGEKLLDREEK